MTKLPFAPLLDKQPHTAASHFDHSLSLLSEMANLGSHLCWQAWESSQRSTTDAQVVFHLLRQIVVDVDAMHHLLSHGLSSAAYPTLRSLLEKEHLFEWSLLGDTELKLKYLFVAAQRAERRGASSVIPGTKENKLLLERFGLTPTESEFIASAKAKEARIERQLQHPELCEVNKSFESGNTAKQHRFDPSWTRAYAKSSKGSAKFTGSAEAIALEIGQADEYHYIYSYLCTHLHGSALFGSLSMNRKMVAPKPIRGFAGYEFIYRWTTILAARAFRKTFEHYMPQRLPEFTEIFKSWSDRFSNIPSSTDEDD